MRRVFYREDGIRVVLDQDIIDGRVGIMDIGHKLLMVGGDFVLDIKYGVFYIFYAFRVDLKGLPLNFLRLFCKELVLNA